jgi:hypothetical protein
VQGDTVKAESGAMITVSRNVNMESKIDGSMMQAFVRWLCAGESMYVTHYSLKPDTQVRTCSHSCSAPRSAPAMVPVCDSQHVHPMHDVCAHASNAQRLCACVQCTTFVRMQNTRGDILLAPSMPGNVILLHVSQHQAWMLQKSAFLASDVSVNIASSAQSLDAALCSGVAGAACMPLCFCSVPVWFCWGSCDERLPTAASRCCAFRTPHPFCHTLSDPAAGFCPVFCSRVEENLQLMARVSSSRAEEHPLHWSQPKAMPN